MRFLPRKSPSRLSKWPARVLDVAFREDESRIRIGHAAENMARLRQMALNLLKQEKTAKVGIKNKRLRAGWDEAYLRRLLALERVESASGQSTEES